MKNVKKLALDLSILDDEAPALHKQAEHKTVYYLPADHGFLEGTFFDLCNDMSLYRGNYSFKRDKIGPEYSFGNAKIEFSEESLMVNATMGGWMRLSDPECGNASSSEHSATFGQDSIYFKRMDKYDLDAFFETTEKLTNTVLTIPVSSLHLLIGKRNTQGLFRFLGVEQPSSHAVRNIPRRINQILHNAVNPHLTGSMRRLYCQAKVLEYLCELVQLMEQANNNIFIEDDGQSAIIDIHDRLIDHVGPLPTMAKLAEEYGISARTLNSKFGKKYGQTIYNYITSVRLKKSHSVICETDIALKKIAVQLGYSHVNHFSTAFKREFGYPPSALRRKSDKKA